MGKKQSKEMNELANIYQEIKAITVNEGKIYILSDLNPISPNGSVIIEEARLKQFIQDNFVANSELKQAVQGVEETWNEILSEETPITDSIMDWLINGKKDE